MDRNVTRRHALSAAALAGVGAAVTACSSGAETTTATATPAGGEAAGAGAGEANPAPAPAGALAKKSDIPVGGGVVLKAEKVVVVQPEAGTFKAYSTVCPHQGCPVQRVKGGLIVCPCHNSTFAIADGSPKSGPAKKGLAEVAISADGDTVTLA
ncbi:Rieske (2Fe-2S) protein [Microtetraspora niveoalba]|uniref:Rieske (2Fe-2S) protein n=1 Tax=Microtetraspora niveoalba TaxID=46175 RepID=UPI0008357D24|nr:Rieske (2Fe-2S) protein [Microtetraspora niveoalba]